MDFREMLIDMLHSVDGAIAASFCGVDGIGVDTVILEKDMEPSETEVEISTMLKMLGEIASNLRAGKVRSFIFEAENFDGIVEKCGDDYFLSILVKPSSNIGKSRYILRKYARKLEKEI